MTTFAHPTIATRSYAYRRPADSVFGQLVHRLRRSRSLASMLPALLFSGLMTLVVTAVMHVTSGAVVDGFVARWMESWLTAWPIAFPVAYLTGPAVLRLAAAISAPARMQPRHPGLAFGDIADASRRVTRRNRYAVLRGLKPTHDFSAV
ncbi:DUF2798 domain-containing protein [Noviherbaspirillum sp. ST9]|uniref:DUF2798 domain-containing protein n=1 Tax=Noviherbaspirillum sp. ST9 TaxID=3401606 RepID=UPI003B5885E2